MRETIHQHLTDIIDTARSIDTEHANMPTNNSDRLASLRKQEIWVHALQEHYLSVVEAIHFEQDEIR